MNAIWKRELRRLMPLGLGLPALLLALAAWIQIDNSFLGMSLEGVLVLSLTAIPAILAVGTIAPDTGSGGIAFLSRLPVSRARTLVPKAMAAAAWSAFAWGLVLLVHPSLPLTLGELRIPESLWNQAAVALFLFASGLLASVVARRTMAAILLAPIIALVVTVFALGIPTLALGVRWPRPEPVLGALGAGLALVAFVAFTRGDRHRASARPALLATGGTALTLVLSMSATACARSVSVARAAFEIPVQSAPGTVSPDGHTVAIVLRGDRWTGTEARVAIVDRGDGSSWFVPARNVDSPAFSPDGRWLLLRSTSEAGGFLVDTQSHGASSLAAPPGYELMGFGFTHVAWHEDRPVLLRKNGRKIETFAPGAPASAIVSLGTLPEKFELLAVDRDGRLVGRDATGLVRVTLAAPLVTERVHEVGTGSFEAVASSTGRRVLLRRTTGTEVAFDLVDLDGPVRVASVSLGDAASYSLPESGAVFSPSERRFVLFSPAGSRTFFESTPEAQRQLATVARQINRTWTPVVWSRDEHTAAVFRGDVVSVETGKLVIGTRRFVAAFLDRGRYVGTSLTLAARSLETCEILDPLVRH